MVGERGVHAGNLYLGHVAGNAVVFAYGAGCAWVVFEFFSLCCYVAGQTLLIVGGRVLHELLVGIVAGDTGESGVASAPATAAFQTIGLEAHVGDAGGAGLHDVSPGAMACAAEIDRGYRIEALRIQDGAAAFFDFSRFHGGDVFGAGAVALFAGDSGSGVRGVEVACDRGAAGVAAETATCFVAVETTA